MPHKYPGKVLMGHTKQGFKMSKFSIEIAQQPEVLQRIVNSSWDVIDQFVERVKKKPVNKILIAARGTSDNAAVYAKYLISAFIRIPVGLAIPSLYTIYDQPPDMTDGVVIGISQSGHSTDVLAVLEDAKRKNVPTLSITNDESSPLSMIADFPICLNAGVESAIAASKTYTATLSCIAMLIASWENDVVKMENIKKLPVWVEEVLLQSNNAKKIANLFAEYNQLVVLGRGFNYCTAHEIALKIKELSYMVSEAYSAADFRHGPIAMLGKNFPVIAVAPRDKSIDDMKEMIKEVKELGVHLATISNDEEVLKQSDYHIAIPKDIPGWLSPIVGTIPGQMLAKELAEARGLDVDNPRGLKKITLTL
jgi:glucosamine--fructose-6-phosphate aminotransferase (isomerizing)